MLIYNLPRFNRDNVNTKKTWEDIWKLVNIKDVSSISSQMNIGENIISDDKATNFYNLECVAEY